MIQGLSTYTRIWGLKRDPDVSSGFANGKMLLVGSACKSIRKCKSSFQTDQSFFRSTEILEQSKMLMECTCGTSMDFYPHALASLLCSFRAWQGRIECNTTYFQGVLKASCCNLGNLLAVANPDIAFFISTWSDLEHNLLHLCSLDALALFCKTVSICPHLLRLLLLRTSPL